MGGVGEHRFTDEALGSCSDQLWGDKILRLRFLVPQSGNIVWDLRLVIAN